MEQNQLVNEIIWAKLGGYPWWPGYIKSKLKNKYEVCFFGDFTRAYLLPNKIRPFLNSDIEKNKDNKKLQ